MLFLNLPFCDVEPNILDAAHWNEKDKKMKIELTWLVLKRNDTAIISLTAAKWMRHIQIHLFRYEILWFTFLFFVMLKVKERFLLTVVWLHLTLCPFSLPSSGPTSNRLIKTQHNAVRVHQAEKVSTKTITNSRSTYVSSTLSIWVSCVNDIISSCELFAVTKTTKRGGPGTVGVPLCLHIISFDVKSGLALTFLSAWMEKLIS